MRAHGVESLYLFGSRALNEQTDSSDVDIFVDPASSDFSALEHYVGAYDVLTAAIALPVDFGTRAGLSRHLLADIEREAIRIF